MSGRKTELERVVDRASDALNIFDLVEAFARRKGLRSMADAIAAAIKADREGNHAEAVRILTESMEQERQAAEFAKTEFRPEHLDRQGGAEGKPRQ
jgi:hypothetical protein